MLSFEQLYVAYSPSVYRFSYWLAGNPDDAEDITSETFIRAWKNYDSTRTETLKAYLFTIARNIYLESLKKNRMHDTLKETHLDSAPSMQKMFEEKSELNLIQSIIQTIPETDRSAFVMRIQHDLSYAEIARVLQLSEGAVKVRVHRVRKRLFNVYSRKEPK